MSVIPLLACSLGRRDEAPNQDLARHLVERQAASAIQEIAANLWNKANVDIPADCIKVLYEMGYLQPAWIIPYADDFIRLLRSRNNRLAWGGMLALATIAVPAADELFPQFAAIQKAINEGSVITRDAGVQVLAGIASTSGERRQAILPHLLDHLRTCRLKDVPQHGEKIIKAVDQAHKEEFIAVLSGRLQDMTGTQVKRIEKVIRRARKL